MDGKNRKAEFIDATMQIVAEVGLASFSMKKVTNRVGVGETLIYKYFETKDKLLYTCFESVHKQIAALFSLADLPPTRTPQEVYQAIRTLWMDYFSFMVQNSYRTIFYFEYRGSHYIRYIMKEDDEVQKTYFQEFIKIIQLFDEQFHIFEKASPDHVWTYILDTTGIFAKRVIRGELPDTEESRESIWRLLFSGLSGLLQ